MKYRKMFHLVPCYSDMTRCDRLVGSLEAWSARGALSALELQLVTVQRVDPLEPVGVRVVGIEYASQ